MIVKLYRFLAVILFICAMAGEVLAQERLIFGHSGWPESLFDLSARHFAKLVEQRLQRRVTVEVYGKSQLGTDLMVLEMLQHGKSDLALPSATMLSVVAPEFALFEMPYLVRDRDHMRRIEKEIVWPILAPVVERNGYKILGVWESGFRHITNNRRPIRVPEDLKGMKLRTPRNSWRITMFQAFGATPTPIPFGEVFTAMQAGIIDGQENVVAQISDAKLYEVQKYLSLTGHVYTPAFLVMGLNRWNRLDRRTQNVLMEAAKETQAYVYGIAAHVEEKSLKNLIQNGIKINEVDRDAFVNKSKVIYDEFARSVKGSANMISRALQLGERR